MSTPKVEVTQLYIKGEYVAEVKRTDYPDGTKNFIYRSKKGEYKLPDGVTPSDLDPYGFEDGIPEGVDTVVICEGNKARLAVPSKFYAIGTHGSTTIPNDDVLKAIAEWQRGDDKRSIVLFPDHDKPGLKHMLDLAVPLDNFGTENIRHVVQEADTPKGYDAAKAKVMTKYGIGDGHQGKSLGDLSKAKYKQFFKDMDKAVAKL